MSEIVANCPRCGAEEMTFDLISEVPTFTNYKWQQYLEAFCICRKCKRPTIFILSQREHKDERLIKNGLANYKDAVNRIANVEGHISIKDFSITPPPEHLPQNIGDAFREGAACMSIACHNAAGTMFRLCVDLATRGMLPEGNENGLNSGIRRSLGLRLPWLFENNILPEALRGLSNCIKNDGNDGAHEGALSEEDANDIQDFTCILLERIFTEPKKIEIANERRDKRHQSKS